LVTLDNAPLADASDVEETLQFRGSTIDTLSLIDEWNTELSTVFDRLDGEENYNINVEASNAGDKAERFYVMPDYVHKSLQFGDEGGVRSVTLLDCNDRHWMLLGRMGMNSATASSSWNTSKFKKWECWNISNLLRVRQWQFLMENASWFQSNRIF
jgi:hypothetical protein